MVSIKQTSLKYHGKKAETYDEIRMKQARWDFENEVVGGWLATLKPNKVLDCPVGTGRFIGDYAKLGCNVIGLDISEEMVALAEQKRKKAKAGYINLMKGSATATGEKDKSFDGAVCVRFLDLIDEDAMKQVMIELARVSKKWIICTIRLGEKYTPKSNTAEHDEKKYRALVKKLGFTISDTKRFREGSWHVLLLTRGK